MSSSEPVPGGLLGASIAQVAELVKRRELSPVELTDAFLRAAEERGASFNCFLRTLPDQAVRAAKRLEAMLARGEYLGPLHGIPVSIKDNIAVPGVPMTAGSPLFAGQLPDRPATVVRRLEQAGAVIVAKDNMYDLAYCAPNPRYGPTRNPWHPERSCAGSSSGSAAAVAGRLSFASVATDGGGSIRMPASFCGVLGLKTTYGLLSRAGEVPFHPTLSTLGPITRTAADAALVLHAVAGRDPADPATRHCPDLDFTGALEDGVDGLRLGVADLDRAVLHPAVRDRLAEVYQVLAGAGADLRVVTFPDFELARTMMWVISGPEAAELLHEQLRSGADQMHPYTRALLERSEHIPAPLYLRAQRLRRRLMDELTRLFADVDALVLPATPMPAYRIGQQRITVGGVEEEPLAAATRYTTLFNLTGTPALAMPCGFSDAGLPISVQLAGPAFGEPVLLRIAHTYQQLTRWHAAVPPSVPR